MKILRTLLLLLLCAMLPLSGLAASGLTGPCPMQALPSADHDRMMPADTDMAGCETMQPPANGKVKSPSSCKMTAQCQLGSLYYPVSLPVVHRPAGMFSPVTFFYTESLLVGVPDGPWRPPRAL